MEKIKKIIAMILVSTILISTVALGVNAENEYSVSDIVSFGSYPQTQVQDQKLLDTLNHLDLNWQSYNYMNGTNTYLNGRMTSFYKNQMYVDDYMKFADVSFQNERYRAVCFTTYRPLDISYLSSEDCKNLQEKNGFKCNEVYWFKYEPIKWIILNPDDGLVICKSVLDSQPFNNYAYCIYSDAQEKDICYGDGSCTYLCNNYEMSTIRRWLNDDFYNTAFSANERNYISVGTFDNDSENYQGDWTEVTDKISLLSYSEINNIADEDTIKLLKNKYEVATDYALSQGYYDTWIFRTAKNSEYTIYGACRSNFASSDFTFHTDAGIRPITHLSNLKLLQQNNTEIKGEGNSETKASEIYNGIKIIINNDDFNYPVGEPVIVAVSKYQNNVEEKIEKLSVKSSDDNILKITDIIDFSELFQEDVHKLDSIVDISKLLDTPQLMKEYEKCKFVRFIALSEGTVTISITDSDSGDTRCLPISIYKDQFSVYRIDNLKSHGENNDRYDGYSRGVYITDLSHIKQGSGYNVSMNLYNHNHCPGVVEVYDGEGKLINVKSIKKFTSFNTGIIKTFQTLGTMVIEGFQGKMFSIRSSELSEKTTIENLFIPKDGYFIVTCDIELSKVCNLSNMIDAILSFMSVTKSIKKLVSGEGKITINNIEYTKTTLYKDLIKKIQYNKSKTLEKTWREYVYLEIVKKFLDKIKDDIKKKTINISNYSAFMEESIQCFDSLVKTFDLSFGNLFKLSFGAITSVAEDVFTHYTGINYIVDGVFTFENAYDLYYLLNDTVNLPTGTPQFTCYMPATGPMTKLNNEYVSVKTNNCVPSTTVLESYRIYDSDEVDIVIDSNKKYSDFEEYEIALANDGEYIQPNGTVDVFVKSPFENACVARKNDNGLWESIDCSIEDGLVHFKVDHFCKFAIINITDENNSIAKLNKDTEKDIFSEERTSKELTTIITIVIIALIIIIALAIVIFVAKRRK